MSSTWGWYCAIDRSSSGGTNEDREHCAPKSDIDPVLPAFSSGRSPESGSAAEACGTQTNENHCLMHRTIMENGGRLDLMVLRVLFYLPVSGQILTGPIAGGERFSSFQSTRAPAKN